MAVSSLENLMYYFDNQQDISTLSKKSIMNKLFQSLSKITQDVQKQISISEYVLIEGDFVNILHVVPGI